MIKRTLEISEPSYVRMKNAQFIIEREQQTIASIPIEDLGIVILQHPAIVITQAVIIACQKNNVALLFSDERHIPYSIILPVSEGHTLHQKVLRLQVEASKPIKKKIWQQIVQQKIAAQKNTLTQSGVKTDAPLLTRLVTKVKPGDAENHEAQAAQYYWRQLFGKSFRRDYKADGENALLNYGYAVIRALIARAIVAGGLHPALGIHHHNQYNALCLADDLMEPFRPWVDLIVYRIWTQQEKVEINRDAKQQILEILRQSVRIKNKTMPLLVACHHLIANFKRCLDGSEPHLKYPTLVNSP